MPSSYGRVVVAAVFVFLLTFSQYAHAAETTTVTINDPFTDTIQLWTVIFASIDNFAHQIALTLPAHQAPPSSRPAAVFAAAAQSASLAEAVASFDATDEASSTVQTPAPESPSSSTSISQPIIERVTEYEPLASEGYVTQDQLTALLEQLSNSLTSNFNSAELLTVPAWAPSQAIDNLSNVTITNANLTASEIPALDYLSLSGGTLSGTLNVPTLNASSTIYDALAATNASTTLFSNFGTAYFGSTATSTFDSAGDLTLGGSLIAPGNATLGNATTTSLFSTIASSTNLYASTADVGTLSAGAISLTSALPVTSGGTGSTTLSGLLKGNGTGGLASAVAGTDYQVPLAFSYPFINTGNTVSLGFGTTTANTWTGLQTLASGFISNASSTITGALTTTGVLTISAGSGTVFSATGNAAFGTGQTMSLNLVGGSSAVKVQAGGANAVLDLQSANDEEVNAINGSGGVIAQFFDNANGSSANYLQIRNATTGNGPTINAVGTDSNININYTAKGTGIHSFNAEVQAPIFDSTQPTYSLSGSSLTPVFNLTTNWTGTTTASGVYPYEMIVPSDTVNASGDTNGFSPFAAKFNFGGTGFSGGRNWFLLSVDQTAAISDSVSNQQYAVLPIWGQLNYSAGGTNSNAGSKGSYYGTNPQVVLSSGATNWALTNTLGEVDTAWQSGSSGRDKYFASFVHLSTDAVQATRNDSFLAFGSQLGATAPSKMGLQWGIQGGPFPLDPNVGTISGIVPQSSCGNSNLDCEIAAPKLFAGDDYVLANFSLAAGFPFRSPNFSVNGTGGVSIANALIAATSTGIEINIPNEIVAGITISQPGNATGNGQDNFYPSDIVNGPDNGQYEVATTKAIAATVASGGTGGTSGACTVTGTTGSGTDFQASGTVSGGALGGTLTIVAAGSYTANPTNPASEPVTGCGLSGATVDVGIGIATLTILVPDAAATPPSNPVSLLNGSGAGATANLTWSVKNSLALNPSGGNVGIGTTSPYSRLTLWGLDTASTSVFVISNSASTTEFSVLDNGNATLAGTLTQNSDERLKTNIQSLDASSSLSLIEELTPVTFNWIDPNKGTEPQLGFIAQQVLPIFPNLVSTTSPTALTPDGTLSLNYIGLISPIVSAIQALDQEVSNLATTVAGFAQSFTTHILTGDEVTANNELCVGSTCVTPTQFQAMVAAANESEATPDAGDDASSNSQATDTPPVIQINGDNPAIVQVGDTYNDLGATITEPQGDLNLGITTYVNGIETSPVQIDTSAAATDTVDYVVTDQNGLTSTTTRTVFVEAPSIVPSNDASTTATTSASTTATQ